MDPSQEPQCLRWQSFGKFSSVTTNQTIMQAPGHSVRQNPLRTKREMSKCPVRRRSSIQDSLVVILFIVPIISIQICCCLSVQIEKNRLMRSKQQSFTQQMPLFPIDSGGQDPVLGSINLASYDWPKRDLNLSLGAPYEQKRQQLEDQPSVFGASGRSSFGGPLMTSASGQSSAVSRGDTGTKWARPEAGQAMGAGEEQSLVEIAAEEAHEAGQQLSEELGDGQLALWNASVPAGEQSPAEEQPQRLLLANSGSIVFGPRESDEGDADGQQRTTKVYLASSAPGGEQDAAAMAEQQSQQPQQLYMLANSADLQQQLEQDAQLAEEQGLDPANESTFGNTTAEFVLVPTESKFAEENRNSHEENKPPTRQTSLSSAAEQEPPAMPIQLPSQYDSVIRVPPEGHYDDYFKPAGAAQAAPLASNSSAPPTPAPNENNDNIQLIVANSAASNSQDPVSEKLIHYTSEGKNFTKTASKPARHTFVNKDLNELPPAPPAELYQAPRQRQTEPQLIAKSAPQNDTSNSTNSSAGGMQLYELRQRETPVQVALPSRAPHLLASFRREAKLFEQPARQEAEAGPLALVLRTTPRARVRVRVPKQHARAESRHQGNFNLNHHNHNHNHHQQSAKRPQVTEAHFNPRELPMSAPTPRTTLAETVVNAMSEVPMKAERLKDHQVDKHELMNELLTALDRVKSAIYKLQPLTARMNAIYRKSVTSNTRDIIMDHHKGTYAKRYPPGDYDDTYDRMHPSELAERSRSSSPARSSPKKRRRSGNERANKTRQLPESFEAGESQEAAVYLPAPGDLIRRMGLSGAANRSSSASGEPQGADGGDERWSRRLGEQIESRKDTKLAGQPVSIVATGFGRRSGANGSEALIRSQISIDSADGRRQVVYDDDQDQDHNYSLETDASDSSGSELFKRSGAANLEDDQSPLFGYRITIYQAPEGESSNELNSSENELLSYKLIGSLDGGESGGELTIGPRGQTDDEEDSMATSESSVSAARESTATPTTNATGAPSDGPSTDGSDIDETYDDSFGEDKDESESKKKESHVKKHEKKHKKQMEEEEKHKKHDKKAKGDKKGEKKKMHHEKGKKGEEEHKKKKEFKKIKHSKGVMSKESHKLHRDKHIKAHDRGAAKEKALKERTQIEFFEREQIVDDEFEKAKKSTVKAGWASGHDAKKTHDHYGSNGGKGDSISAGGSDTVNHYATEPISASPSDLNLATAASEHSSSIVKGQGHSTETSTGKQSNKFEKKHMEAKGKKFKGWREKGYKIITETEFIDRGSLHDSAYKKRDKGAAHHQKFKKHESKSEGHHGSMHEHHKKMHKNAEKKSKSEERKKEMMGKEEGEKAKKHKHGAKKESVERKKNKKQKEEHDHDHEESAPMVSSLIGFPRMEVHRRDSSPNQTDRELNLNRTKPPANSMALGLSTPRPQLSTPLMRLIERDHDQGESRHAGPPRSLRPDNLKTRSSEPNLPAIQSVQSTPRPEMSFQYNFVPVTTNSDDSMITEIPGSIDFETLGRRSDQMASSLSTSKHTRDLTKLQAPMGDTSKIGGAQGDARRPVASLAVQENSKPPHDWVNKSMDQPRKGLRSILPQNQSNNGEPAPQVGVQTGPALQPSHLRVALDNARSQKLNNLAEQLRPSLSSRPILAEPSFQTFNLQGVRDSSTLNFPSWLAHHLESLQQSQVYHRDSSPLVSHLDRLQSMAPIEEGPLAFSSPGETYLIGEPIMSAPSIDIREHLDAYNHNRHLGAPIAHESESPNFLPRIEHFISD